MGVLIMLLFLLVAVAAIRFAAMAVLQRAVAGPVAGQVAQGPRAGLRARDPDLDADDAEREARLTERRTAPL